MATEPLIAPTDAEATATLDTSAYPYVTIMASNIASTEYVDVNIVDNYGSVITPLVWDSRSHAIDDTNAAVTVQGGPTLSITKSATASASAAVCWSPSKFY